MAGFVPLSSQRENVGGIIKSSKRKHTWTFILSGKTHEVVLFESRVNGQVTVILDGVIKVRTEARRYEEYPLNIGGRVVYVYKNIVGSYDVRVGRFAFSKIVSERVRLHRVPGALFEASNNDTIVDTLPLLPASKPTHRRSFTFRPTSRI